MRSIGQGFQKFLFSISATDRRFGGGCGRGDQDGKWWEKVDGETRK